MPYVDNATILAADKELRYFSRFRTERWPYMRDNCHPPTRPEPHVPPTNKPEINLCKPSSPPVEDTRPQAVNDLRSFAAPIDSDARLGLSGRSIVSPQHTPINRLSKTSTTPRSVPRKRVSKYSVSPEVAPVTPVTPQPRLPFKDLVNRPLDHMRYSNTPTTAPNPAAANPQPTKKRRYKYDIID